MPPSRQREVLRAWGLAVDRTAGYLYSRCLLAAASTVAHGLFFWLIGVPYGLALGLWVGVVSQFVPTIGTYIAGVLPAVVALATDPIDLLWILLFMTVYQTLENYVLVPPLTAKSLSIHPGVAFASVIVGAAILGPVGALLALPATASIQAFASAYVRSYEVVDQPPAAPRGGRPSR
jgi:predicted PurR-regulated permease PerM